MQVLSISVLSAILYASVEAEAQQNTQKPRRASTQPATGGFGGQSSSYIQPGWQTTKLKYGLGYSTNFLNSSNLFVFETFGDVSSWSYYFGFNKSADNRNTTNTTVVTGTGPTTTTETEVNSGQVNPMSTALGISYHRPMFQNHWMTVRWGGFGGIDYYFDTSYDTGTNRVVVNSATPDTKSITETNLGKIEVQRQPVLTVGPMVDSFFYLRWLPQLAVGLQGGIFLSTSSKTTTVTKTRSRTYDRVNGVNQTPTSDSSTDNEQVVNGGPRISSFASNGSTFSLFGNFVLRYVW